MRKALRLPTLLTGLALTAALVSGCDENEDSEEPDTEETTETSEEEPEDSLDSSGWVTFGDCPIDVPEPATSYEIAQEMPVDGVEVFCTIEVNADGDVQTHWDAIAASFSDEDASQVEDNPALDATDPNDIAIQAWTLADYEVIVNMRANDADSTNLIYVVRDTERQG